LGINVTTGFQIISGTTILLYSHSSNKSSEYFLFICRLLKKLRHRWQIY